MKHLVAPSILAADFARLGEAVKMVDESEADWVHVDVMDGRFVPNLTFGPPVIAAVRGYTKKFFDVHLMMVEPEKFFDDFKAAGADGISVHIEVCAHLHRIVHLIKEKEMRAGVAINPHTNVRQLEDILPEIDVVCMMSVNPGWGGQKFIQGTLQRVRKLRELILATGSRALVEVDGGVDAENARSILKAGADVLVAGSSVFRAKDPKAVISELKHIDVNTIIV